MPIAFFSQHILHQNLKDKNMHWNNTNAPISSELNYLNKHNRDTQIT